MPRVGVLFELSCSETVPGEALCIVGGHANLGDWARSKAWERAECASLNLRTNVFKYPRWAMIQPIWLDVPTGGAGLLRLEYKYVIDRRAIEQDPGWQMRWEDAISNRVVELPCEDGRIWLVSDKTFNRRAVCAAPRMIAASEVAEIWSCYDPEWTPTAQKKQEASEGAPSPGASTTAAAASSDSSSDDGEQRSAASPGGAEDEPRAEELLAAREEEASASKELAAAQTEYEEPRERRLQDEAFNEAISKLQAQHEALRKRVRRLAGAPPSGHVSDSELGAILAVRKQISDREEGSECSVEDSRLASAPTPGNAINSELGVILAVRKRISDREEGTEFSVEDGSDLLRMLTSPLRRKVESNSGDEQDATSTVAPSATTVTTPRLKDADVPDLQTQKGHGARTPNGPNRHGGAFFRRRFFRVPVDANRLPSDFSRLSSFQASDFSRLSSWQAQDSSRLSSAGGMSRQTSDFSRHSSHAQDEPAAEMQQATQEPLVNALEACEAATKACFAADPLCDTPAKEPLVSALSAFEAVAEACCADRLYDTLVKETLVSALEACEALPEACYADQLYDAPAKASGANMF